MQTMLRKFKGYIILLMLSPIASFFIQATPAPFTIEGRWDMTLTREGKTYPSWLEVMHSGHKTWVGQYVGIVGSARPISQIHFKEGKIQFSLPPQWDEGEANLEFEGSVAGDNLEGTLTGSDGKKYEWKAVRAPELKPTATPAWGSPIKLFNGTDLKGWHAAGANQWVVENGVLKSPKSGSNLVSDASFKDFKLHFECRYPKGSNSGMYLRGRYELQVMDSKGTPPSVGGFGAIYGFIKPSEQAAGEPGEWQTFDVTLVGRMITVVANGKTIICNVEIPGITGGALDSNEGQAGPLQIQGDHGPVEYRNIVITPAK